MKKLLLLRIFFIVLLGHKAYATEHKIAGTEEVCVKLENTYILSDMTMDLVKGKETLFQQDDTVKDVILKILAEIKTRKLNELAKETDKDGNKKYPSLKKEDLEIYTTNFNVYTFMNTYFGDQKYTDWKEPAFKTSIPVWLIDFFDCIVFVNNKDYMNQRNTTEESVRKKLKAQGYFELVNPPKKIGPLKIFCWFLLVALGVVIEAFCGLSEKITGNKSVSQDDFNHWADDLYEEEA